MNPTHTFSDPNLTLQCSTDEKMLAASFPSGRERAIVTAETNPVTGVIRFSAGEKTIYADDLEASATTIFDSASVGGNIIYVSPVATNGYAIGSDSNNGLSKQTAKLTVAGALAIAKAGDTIMLNDGAYTEAYFRFLIALNIQSETDYGAKLVSTATSVVGIGNAPVTLGKIIIDTNNYSTTSCIYGFGSDTKTLLTLDGTHLIAHAQYCVNFNASLIVKGDVTVTHTGAGKSIWKCSPNAGHIVRFENAPSIGAPLYVIAGGLGTALTLYRSKFRYFDSTTGTNYAAFVSGVADVHVEGCELGVDGNLGPAGINIEPIANFPVNSVVIKDNVIRHEGYTSLAQSGGGYGIKVGSESFITDNIGAVTITGNKLVHVNHCAFLGYGITQPGLVRGNVVIDGLIPFLSKGNMSASKFYANVALGGSWSGGALRSKTSNPIFKNNLCVANSLLSASLGKFQHASDASVNAVFQNNILYAPSIAIPIAASADIGSTASFSNNNYHAGSFNTGAFVNGATTYNTVSAWAAAVESTATAVDPGYTLGNWSLPSESSILTSGLPASEDFFGTPRSSNSLGPF